MDEKRSRATRLLTTLLAGALGLVSACTSVKQAGPVRAPRVVRQLVSEDGEIQRICRSLETHEATPAALSEQAHAAIELERTRDTCRLAKALSGTTKAESAGSAKSSETPQDVTQCLAIIEGSGPLGAQLAALGPEAIAARFDLSLVVAIKLVELGERTSTMVERMSQSFGRLSGMVQLSLEALIGELAALGLENVLDHPEIRKFAGPTEVARESCRIWKEAEPKPVITQRLLERSILRLAHAETNRMTLDDACQDDPSLPGCKPLVKVAARKPELNVESLCESTGWPHQRGQCRQLSQAVSAMKAHPLQALCEENTEDPTVRSCKPLAASAGKAGKDIDALCGSTKVPHLRWRCERAVEQFAAQGRWHPSEAENTCRAQPSRCRRYRRKLLDRPQQDKPLDPNPDLGLDDDPDEDAFDDQVAQCISEAAEQCQQTTAGHEDEHGSLLSCIADNCSIALARRSDDMESFSELLSEVGQVRASLTGLHQRLDALSGSVQRVGYEVESVDQTTGNIKSEVSGLPQQVGEAVSQALQEANLVKDADFEKAVSSLAERLDQLEALEKDLRQIPDQVRDALERISPDIGIEVAGQSLRISLPDAATFGQSKTKVANKKNVCALAEVLNSIIEQLGPSSRSLSIHIIGHASPIPNSPTEKRGITNMKLSADRAIAIYDLLTQNNELTARPCKSGRRQQDCNKCPSLIGEKNVSVMVVGRGDHDFVSGPPSKGRGVIIEIKVEPGATR